jgi:hypothetical protein
VERPRRRLLAPARPAGLNPPRQPPSGDRPTSGQPQVPGFDRPAAPCPADRRQHREQPFCSQRGGDTTCSSRSNSLATTTSCGNGRGAPRAFVSPAAAIPQTAWIICSNRRPGLTSTRTCASRSPTFQKSWTIPGSTTSLRPGAGDLLPVVEPEPDPPLQHLEALVQVAVHLRPGPTGPRAQVQVGDHRLPVGVVAAPGGPPERSPLTGVLELLTGMGHDHPHRRHLSPCT